MDVQLVMFKENGQQKVFTLDPGKTVIGRREECDLRIPLAEISRKHALVLIDDKTVTIRDMGSANGTYLNNKRISEEDLAAGDHIVVGPVVFTVRINGEPEEVKPVHTRLEARSREEAGGTPAGDLVTQKSESADPLEADDDDPISALEALAGSDDTAALDIDDLDDEP